MMKKFLLSIAVLLVIVGGAIAQQKANFALAERFSEENVSKMAGDLSVNPNWINKGDTFWYTFKNFTGRRYVLVNPVRKTKTPLFDSAEMASKLTALTGKPANAVDLELKDIKFDESGRKFTFIWEKTDFAYDLNSKLVSKKDKINEANPPRWAKKSPDGKWAAFVKDHNLYIMASDDPDSTEIQLSKDGEKWFSYGNDNTTNPNGKRVRTSAEWFKDSKKLYVHRADARKVGESWVINSLSEPRPTLETYREPLPGEENVYHHTLEFFDIESKSWVNADVKKWDDQALGGWYGSAGIFAGESSDVVYFVRSKRTWDELEVCAADTKTGEVRVLFNEIIKPYFNINLSDFKLINGDKEFLWMSERDGYEHIYRYDVSGKLLNRVTSGSFVVGAISKTDDKTQTIYFEAYGKEDAVDPYYNMYYKVLYDGRVLQHLTPEEATHSFDMSESSKYFVDTFSRVDKPAESVLRDSQGKVVLELEKTDVTKLMEAGYKYQETFSVKAADGVTDLYGVMWKPFDFDPAKKYPIISYVYPGPQVEPVPTAFLEKGGRYGNLQLSQVGFIVVAVGQRGGSPKRPKYYHNYGFGDLRDYGLADNKAALEQLADRHKFIDIEKVGIYGHSGGGFMSTAAMLVYPDFYKAAVSSAGNHDNNIYYFDWAELHNGGKWETKKDKDGNETKVFNAKVKTNQELAKNLKGHLLLVHGDIDNNVNPANSIRVADALIKAGKRFDFMYMPGKRHGYEEYVHYFETMMYYYFAEHLLGDYRSTVEMFNKGK